MSLSPKRAISLGKRALSLLCAFTLAMAVVQFPVTLA